MSIECGKCKKINLKESNFCSRCGVSLKSKKKCPICLETKKNVILICGHTCCLTCINSSYKIKKECPVCRKEINKCPKCNSFRVEDFKCLDCNHISIKLNKKTRTLCIDCKSTRVLYNHDFDNWSCLDCFTNFEIKDDIASVSNIASTTKICSLCCSNDIEYTNFGNKCLNCENNDVKVKNITLEEYSHLRIKTKEEVAKKLKNLYSCLECDSNDVCKMYNLNDPIEELFYCKKCNKTGVKVKQNI